MYEVYSQAFWPTTRYYDNEVDAQKAKQEAIGNGYSAFMKKVEEKKDANK